MSKIQAQVVSVLEAQMTNKELIAENKVLRKALEMVILDHIADGEHHYCRKVCKMDYCSPDKSGVCVKEMGAYFIRKAKEATK